MGPRLGGRGDWIRCRPFKHGLSMLQWGRGSVAAEISTALARITPGWTSFNGAAARWPRR